MPMSMNKKQCPPVPCEQMPNDKAPGHWLLARLGKRVLRPGGLDLTRHMIRSLAITRADHVVEFAPGMGITARLTLKASPQSFTAIEHNEDAAQQVEQYLRGVNQQCIVSSAHETCLPSESATVVYGEAMFSMQPSSRKLEIIKEAARILKPGGRYAIHELCLAPANIDPELQKAIHRDLSEALHVGATPLVKEQWVLLLQSAGFKVTEIVTAPMALLEPDRMVSDEGLFRFLKIILRLLKDPSAWKRVSQMRSIFHKHKEHLAAVVIIAEKL
ncbi:MAG: putative SAM-dependent methyltransferase [Vampirovibrio sp.]|nr:putative SAM-dependent methyltransferase [Vampirovibrio sp.]